MVSTWAKSTAMPGHLGARDCFAAARRARDAVRGSRCPWRRRSGRAAPASSARGRASSCRKATASDHAARPWPRNTRLVGGEGADGRWWQHHPELQHGRNGGPGVLEEAMGKTGHPHTAVEPEDPRTRRPGDLPEARRQRRTGAACPHSAGRRECSSTTTGVTGVDSTLAGKETVRPTRRETRRTRMDRGCARREER
jgi:hypothetical protein